MTERADPCLVLAPSIRRHRLGVRARPHGFVTPALSLCRACSIVAAIVLVPLLAHGARRLQDAGRPPDQSVRLPARMALGQLLPTSSPAPATGRCSAIRCSSRRAHRGADAGLVAAHGRLHLRACEASSARASCSNYLPDRHDVPGGDRDPAALHPASAISACSTPIGAWCCRRSPSASAWQCCCSGNFFQQRAVRAVRRRLRRRLRLSRLLSGT